MRINVYSEELTDRVEVKIEPPGKVAKDVTFVGLQFFVGPKLMHTPGDDDSSAVTFWFSDEYSRDLLRKSLVRALEIVNDPNLNL